MFHFAQKLRSHRRFRAWFVQRYVSWENMLPYPQRQPRAFFALNFCRTALSYPHNLPLIPGSHHQPYARCGARFHAAPPRQLVLPAAANYRSGLMRDDPARLTSCIGECFIAGYVAVRVAPAFGIIVNPTWDWEQW